MNDALTSVFKGLGNRHRLRILLALEKGERTVTELAELLEVRQPTVSQHLNALRAAGLVNVRREGRFSRVSLRPDHASEIARQLARSREEGVRELTYVWDMRTDEQEWFGGLEEALGFDDERFPRTVADWEERVHPDDRQKVESAMERTLNEGLAFEISYRMRKKDGSYVTWMDAGAVMRDEQGVPYKWVGMVREVAQG